MSKSSHSTIPPTYEEIKTMDKQIEELMNCKPLSEF